MGSKRKLKEKVDGKRPGVGESLEKEKCKTSLEGQLEMQGGCRGASGDKKEQRGSSPTQKRRIFREEVTRAGGAIGGKGETRQQRELEREHLRKWGIWRWQQLRSQ